MDLNQVWNQLQSFNGTESSALDFPSVRVKFYMGAMEIPMISFSPKIKFELSQVRLSGFSKTLSSHGLELDCVEEGGNYKVNQTEDGQYIGRVTRDALKLHAFRVRNLGMELFQAIVKHFFHE